MWLANARLDFFPRIARCREGFFLQLFLFAAATAGAQPSPEFVSPPIAIAPMQETAAALNREHFPSGKIKREVFYKDNNKQNYDFREYYAVGGLKAVGTYVNGQLEGDYKEYYVQGHLKLSAYYQGGRLEGPVREFYDSGMMKSEGNFIAHKLEGKYISYLPSGKKSEEVSYRNGVPDGVVMKYHDNGNLKEVFHLVKGRMEGEAKIFDPEGNLEAEIFYRDDKREGSYKEYYSDKALKRALMFQDDKIHGLARMFYPDGTMWVEATFTDGVIDGSYKVYDKLGKLKYQEIYKKGEKIDQFGTPVKVASIEPGRDRLRFVTTDESRDWLPMIAILGIGGLVIIVTWPFSRPRGDRASLIVHSGKHAPRYVSRLSDIADQPDRGAAAVDQPRPEIREKEFNLLLPESEKMYRRLIETVNNGIFLMDFAGNLKYVNFALARIFGFNTKAEVIGRNFVKDLFEHNRADAEAFLARLRSQNAINDYQIQLKNKDGQAYHLSISANSITDDQGSPIAIEGVVLDVTDKAMLESIILREKKKLEHILDFGEQIDNIRDYDELINFVLQNTSEILESERCSILLEKDDQTLRIIGAKGLSEEVIKGTVVRLGEPIAGLVAQTGEPILVKNIEYDERFQRAKRPTYLGRSFMIVPFVLNDKTRGVISVADKTVDGKKYDAYDEIDFRILQTITTKIASAIENIQLFTELNLLTVTDPITQIYNYRRFSESLDHEIRRMKRGEGNLCVIMMDLDKFKEYNDTFGHVEGDALLRQIGQLLKEQLRQTDIVCRYAGDEFCIVLPDTTIEGAQNAAEKVKKAVEEYPFKRKVTFSLGVSKYKPGMTKKELIVRADKALYEAKRGGRNRIVTYE